MKPGYTSIEKLIRFLTLMFFFLTAVSGGAAAGDVPAEYLQAAMEKCHDDYKSAYDKCSQIYIRNYVEQDPEVARNYESCIRTRNETFDQCMSFDKLLSDAKHRQYRDVNRDVLAAWENAQDAANVKTGKAVTKCLKKKSNAKRRACVEKAQASAIKRMAKIDKKYKKRLKPVD
ncbi:MAG: hypothetical protein [Olavius algarvensis Delta 4 endosymbiont]|nr:MAG: hypothetical protein [Olavius algarvensis Delta 4 endosymbiont]